MIIPDVVLIQLKSWGWAQDCSKHVEDSNKHIVEETGHQVGYLPEFMEHVILWKLVIAILFSQELTTCPSVKWIQSTSLHPSSAIPILVLFSHIFQGIPVDLFPSRLLTKILYNFVVCALMLWPLSMLSHANLISSG